MDKKKNTSLRIAECIIEGIKQYAEKNDRSANYYYEKWILAGARGDLNEMNNVLPKELLSLMKKELRES